MSPNLLASLSLILTVSAGLAQDDPEPVVRFELPDADGAPVRSSELASRYVLLVYQGIP